MGALDCLPWPQARYSCRCVLCAVHTFVPHPFKGTGPPPPCMGTEPVVNAQQEHLSQPAPCRARCNCGHGNGTPVIWWRGPETGRSGWWPSPASSSMVRVPQSNSTTCNMPLLVAGGGPPCARWHAHKLAMVLLGINSAADGAFSCQHQQPCQVNPLNCACMVKQAYLQHQLACWC